MHLSIHTYDRTTVICRPVCLDVYSYVYETVGVNVFNVFQNGWANLDEIVNGIVRVPRKVVGRPSRSLDSRCCI